MLLWGRSIARTIIYFIIINLHWKISKKIYRGQQTDRKLLCISYSTCSYWSTNSSSYNWKPKSSWYSDYAWILHTLITTLISLVSQQISFLSFYLTNIDCIPKKDGWNQFLLLPIGMVLNYICMLIWNNFNYNILWSFHYRLLNLVDKWIRNISLWIQHFAWNYYLGKLICFHCRNKIYTTYRFFLNVILLDILMHIYSIYHPLWHLPKKLINTLLNKHHYQLLQILLIKQWYIVY